MDYIIEIFMAGAIPPLLTILFVWLFDHHFLKVYRHTKIEDSVYAWAKGDLELESFYDRYISRFYYYYMAKINDDRKKFSAFNESVFNTVFGIAFYIWFSQIMNHKTLTIKINSWIKRISSRSPSIEDFILLIRLGIMCYENDGRSLNHGLRLLRMEIQNNPSFYDDNPEDPENPRRRGLYLRALDDELSRLGIVHEKSIQSDTQRTRMRNLIDTLKANEKSMRYLSDFITVYLPETGKLIDRGEYYEVPHKMKALLVYFFYRYGLNTDINILCAFVKPSVSAKTAKERMIKNLSAANKRPDAEKEMLINLYEVYVKNREKSPTF